MGVDHGVCKSDHGRYDDLLRWVFAGALLLGWSLGASTDKFDTLFMLWSAFTGGGIMITAIREELPFGQGTHFLPVLCGVVCASAAILMVQTFRNPAAG